MNERMALFLYELGSRSYKFHSGRSATASELGIFNPYRQFPKHVRKPSLLERQYNPNWNYNLGDPAWSKPGFGRAAGVGLTAALTSPLVIAGAVFTGLVLYTALNEPSRYDPSLNIPYRSISGRHHGN